MVIHIETSTVFFYRGEEQAAAICELLSPVDETKPKGKYFVAIPIPRPSLKYREGRSRHGAIATSSAHWLLRHSYVNMRACIFQFSTSWSESLGHSCKSSSQRAPTSSCEPGSSPARPWEQWELRALESRELR